MISKINSLGFHSLSRVICFAVLFASLGAMASATTQGFDHRPVRFWSFSEFAADVIDPFVVAGDGQQGGRLDESFDFGPVIFDFDRPFDGIATGKISSTASGKRFEVFAQAPIGNINEAGSVIGDTAVLDQYQSYEKQADDATLQITISKVLLETIDSNGAQLLPSECPPGIECPVIEGAVSFEARAYSLGAGGDFFHTKGFAGFSGWQGNWQFFAETSAGVATPLWSESSFFATDDVEETGTKSHALAELNHDVTLNVNLSPVLLGELFAVEVRMEAHAISVRGRESAVNVFIRDPERILPAIVQTTGLKRRGAPPLPPPPPDAPPVAECPAGTDPAAGTLQFSASSYVLGEWAGSLPKVVVTRTDGSTGQASITITSSDGSAEAGTDYTAINQTITFADGDTSPRIVEIPILRDALSEPEETVNLTLSNPQCAFIGATTSAVVTIVDDDRVVEPPLTFTIGGMVTGLEGSGLELINLGGADHVAVDANGPFQFPIEVAGGLPYEVTVATQPGNPAQVCTVSNGAGVVADHDVTDIQVDCITTPTSGLDPTFGDGGLVSTLLGESEAIVVQSDGGIISAGNNGIDFALTRHDSNGVLDPTFGGDGIVTTNFGGAGVAIDEAFDLALQTDGKIIAVGRASNTPTVVDFAIARYNPDGTLDTSFGGDGTVTTDFGIDIDGDGIPESGADIANAVVVQPDGKIVVAGEAGVPIGIGLGFDDDFAVARYNPDGSLDTSFGNGGKVTTDLGSDSDIGNDVILQPDGRILMGGQIDQAQDFALARFNPDGSLDLSFAGSGKVVTDFGSSEGIRGMALQPDNSIIVAGFSVGLSSNFDFALARYNPDGSIDAGFGNGGLVTTDVSGGLPSGDDFGEDLALQADGKIVVVGRSTSNTILDFAMVRYNADGSIDSSFVNNGILKIDINGLGDFGQDIAIQPDGKIVGGGYSASGVGLSFVLIRVLP